MLMLPNTSQDDFLDQNNSSPEELKANLSIEDSTMIVDRKCTVKIPYLETDQKTEKKRKKQPQSNDLNMEPPSYSKLIQQIEENHPMDPYTKKPFKMRDRITVKDFNSRLFDAFYIYKFTQWISKTKKLMLKKIGLGKKIEIEKPETLSHIQDSSTDSDDEYGGITLASLKLGDGSALYIQTMKSLSMMFVLLTLLNAPLFLILKNNTHDNQYNLDNIFKYFTLGNIGNTNSICGHSVLDIPLENGTYLNYTEHGLSDPMRLECEEGAYMSEIKYFGFLYKIEQARNQPSSGKQQCDQVLKKGSDQNVKPPKLKAVDQVTTQQVTDLIWINTLSKDFINVDLYPNLLKQNKTEYNLDHQCHSDYFRDEISVIMNSFQLKNELAEQFQPLEILKSQNTTEGQIAPFKDRASKIGFVDYFLSKCFGKGSCQIDLNRDFNLKHQVSEQCIDRIRNSKYKLTSSHYILIPGCRRDFAILPVFLASITMSKHTVGLILVILDIISIIIISLIFVKMKEMNEEYLSIKDDRTVSMGDFGIMIQGLKVDRYSQDPRILKMKVWMWVNNLTKAQRTPHNPMEIIDVTMSMYNQKDLQPLFKIQELQVKINDILYKIRSGEIQRDDKSDALDEIESLRGKIEQFQRKYISSLEVIDVNKRVDKRRIIRTEKISRIDYVFIVFKNTLSAGECLDNFKEIGILKKLIRKMLNKEQAEKGLKMFNGEVVQIQQMFEPEEFIWQNLQYSETTRSLRMFALYFFIFIILIISTAFLVLLEYLNANLTTSFPDFICDDKSYTKLDAYIDKTNDIESGKMGCYCEENTSLFAPWKYFTIEFSDEAKQSRSVEDRFRYCFSWQMIELMKHSFKYIYLCSAVIINGLFSKVIMRVGSYQLRHSQIKLQANNFKLIFFLEFCNMALIALIVSFFIPINDNPVSTDIDPEWYYKYGNYICKSLYMSALISNLIDLAVYLFYTLKRFIDRRFKTSIKKDLLDEDDDQVNTTYKYHPQLVSLYTGVTFQGERAYSRMMSSLFVILLYSSGMPILYLVGAFFFVTTLWLNHYLIISFYKKSKTLTRTIPNFSMTIIQYAVVFHMIMACMMFTNPTPFLERDEIVKNYNWRTLFNEDSMHQIISEQTNTSQTLNATQSDSSFNETVPINEIKDQLQDSLDTIQKGIGQLGNITLVEQFFERFKFFYQQLYVLLLILFSLVITIGKRLKYLLIFIFNLLKFLVVKIQKKLNLRKKNDDENSESSDLSVFDSSKQSDSEDNAQISQINSQMSGVDNSSSVYSQSARNTINSRSLQSIKNYKKEILKRQATISEQVNKQIRYKKKHMLRDDYSENMYLELSMKDLSNYYQRFKHELKDFLALFRFKEPIPKSYAQEEPIKGDFQHQSFIEICFINRVTILQVMKYQKYLLKRISDVELAIDKHFYSITDDIIQQIKNAFEKDRKEKKRLGIDQSLAKQLQQEMDEKTVLKYHDDVQFFNPQIYTYEKKLKKLIDLHQEVIKQDVERRENRKGQRTVCRMNNPFAQSYFMFDMPEFTVAREYYFKLVSE